MWSVKASRYVVKDRWICVRADDCVTASGVEVKPYYSLEYPDFVHVLAVTAEREIVLVRQYRHGYGDMVVELPGGMVDRSDGDVAAAGLRELREETGFVATQATLVGPLSVDPAKFRNRLHLVLAAGATDGGVRDLDHGEEIEVLRLGVDECLALVRAGGFVNAAHIGMLMLGLDRLGLLGTGPAAPPR